MKIEIIEILVLIFACTVTIFVFYRWHQMVKIAEGHLAITNLWCDACKARRGWLLQNPLASRSHPKYQELLQRELGCYMLWLDAHSYSTEQEELRKMHEEMLRRLSEEINEHETFS